jgi:glycosyltransferase involved in cell wall biosynthesis
MSDGLANGLTAPVPECQMTGGADTISSSPEPSALGADAADDFSQLPFMSVVVCAYNSERLIARAIESLISQRYPAERYEILVVDDGSTDRTAEIVQNHPVRLIQHSTNLGVAAARNTGLDHVRGDIYVCFDDDCIVGPQWLLQLAEGYRQLAKDNRQSHVGGVGSAVRIPPEDHSLVARFTAAANTFAPPPLGGPGKNLLNKNLLKRFLSYLTYQLKYERPSSRIEPLLHLYAGTSSFPVSVLRLVNGWDPSLRAAEDLDVCARIVRANPSLRFYGIPTATVVHDPRMSLKQFVRREYVRGVDRLRYYHGMQLTPAFFPLPVLWVAVTAFAALINPLLSLFLAVIMPPFLYPWWLLRAGRERRPSNLIFAFFQLVEEAATLLGILRGYVMLRRERNGLSIGQAAAADHISRQDEPCA